MDTVDRTMEALIDHEQGGIVHQGKTTLIRPFPISIDFEQHVVTASGPEVEREMRRRRRQMRQCGHHLAIGIDRIDYTKGIPERLRALDRLFEEYPEFREQLTLLQVGVPSRGHIDQYQLVDSEIDRLVEAINWRWSTPRWRPVLYHKRHLSNIEMMALHRLADICVVSSLHDGMNLVAKEFVASRIDEDGVLLLSQFAGSAQELSDALLFNPYDVDELTGAFRQALAMAPEERAKRMERMRSAVRDNNVYRWVGKILSALSKVEPVDFPLGDQHARESIAMV
jgi:trehalose 6-phosphate synthase